MKATFPDGTLFEGTPEEYITIHNHSVTAQNGRKAAPKPTNISQVWNEKKARAFWDSLDVWNNGGNQKKLLRFLIKNNGRATDEEIWKHLGLDSGPQLAGILANITRNARREAKDDDVKVVAWMRDAKGVWSHYILDDILQFLKELQ